MSTSASGKKQPGSIVFIGAGNVASHLAPALHLAGAGNVVQIYSRTAASASALAAKIGCTYTDDIHNIIPDADTYIISLADSALPDIIDRLPHNTGALWLHTSGSLPKEILSGLSPRHGVLYPLQTFSKGIDLDIREVPVFTEGSDAATESEITAMASAISDNVRHADSALRKKMHIAAVFACNFTNHLWAISDTLLRKEGMTIEVLHPLVRETLRKAMASATPAACQTGPAAREDHDVMDSHISMLPEDLAAIYTLMSQSIMNSKHHTP